MTTMEYQQLVEFLQGQFTQVDHRLTQIDQGFVQIDRRFTTVDRRFDALEHRLEAGSRDVTAHFDAMYRRLDRLEQEYVAIGQALRRVEGLLADERGRREIVESGVAELKQHTTLLQARIQALEARLRD
jgi:chromosome segregation ATPase